MNKDNIAISESEVRSLVNQLNDQNEEILSILKTLDAETNNIDAAWQGNDATAYIKKMRDDFNVLVKDFNKSLDKYNESLGKVYNKYDIFNEKYANRSIEV